MIFLRSSEVYLEYLAWQGLTWLLTLLSELFIVFILYYKFIFAYFSNNLIKSIYMFVLVTVVWCFWFLTWNGLLNSMKCCISVSVSLSLHRCRSVSLSLSVCLSVSLSLLPYKPIGGGLCKSGWYVLHLSHYCEAPVSHFGSRWAQGQAPCAQRGCN